MAACDMAIGGEGEANLQACIQRVSTVAAKTKLRDTWLQWKGL